jgi:hypothetical protein
MKLPHQNRVWGTLGLLFLTLSYVSCTREGSARQKLQGALSSLSGAGVVRVADGVAPPPPPPQPKAVQTSRPSA